MATLRMATPVVAMLTVIPAVATVDGHVAWPRRVAITTWPRAPCLSGPQCPNRLPISRPTPEITLWIMSPTPDPDGAVADSSPVAPSVVAPGLARLGAPAVESSSEAAVARSVRGPWAGWSRSAESALDAESSWDRPSHRPTVLNAVPTGP